MEPIAIKGVLKRNEPLGRHTSFNIGGPADVLAYPADREDLAKLLGAARRSGQPVFILGGGTNLLVRDGGFRGIVVCLERMAKIGIEREYRSVGGGFTVVAAEAGALLSRLNAFAAEHGLTGFEFSTGIPGTVGGAVCMNAGTADGETGDVIESVELMSADGAPVVRGREEMSFGYRTANIPEGHIVIAARIVLRKGDPEKVKALVKGLIEKRRQRQPRGAPSAGSIFKNPQEESAGKLIETANLKGRRVGGAQVSDLHANFILNTGTATARDVLALMEIVKQAVLDTHGVRLEPEIKIIGED